MWDLTEKVRLTLPECLEVRVSLTFSEFPCRGTCNVLVLNLSHLYSLVMERELLFYQVFELLLM